MNNEQEKEALQYKIEDLQKHIERQEGNIKIFEDAIAKEREGIEQDKEMIAFLKVHQKGLSGGVSN